MNDLASYKLRLDPRIKKAIKETLEQAIYKIVDYRFNERLRDILTENFNLMVPLGRWNGHHHIYYQGNCYTLEMIKPKFPNQRLHPDLVPVMDAWLADVKQLEYYERPFIYGLFGKILNTSNSVLDYREMLPECMHAALDSVELEAQHILPRQMDDAQVEAFKETNSEWILMLKRRMILDLIIV